MKTVLLIGLACLLALAGLAGAEPARSGDLGTIAAIDPKGRITFIPWGGTSADVKPVAAQAGAVVEVVNRSSPPKDLQPGMWIKVEEVSADGLRVRIRAGQFLTAEAGTVEIFRELPGEFLQRDVKDWYTNEAGGVKFKVQFMRGSGEPKITGANLRPSVYTEPPAGFAFYLPASLQGAVLNVHGAKPGVTTPDREGKIVINKETVTESYWSHPKNPAKPELGATSGLTELTIRKLPAPAP